jgi:hypothetical protein
MKIKIEEARVGDRSEFITEGIFNSGRLLSQTETHSDKK